MINDGADTAMEINPTPSKNRLAKSNPVSSAIDPTPPLTAIVSKPRIIILRCPMRSANMPANTPLAMAMAAITETTQPACTIERSSSARSNGNDGGAFPTCAAATTPARIVRITSGQLDFSISIVIQFIPHRERSVETSPNFIGDGCGANTARMSFVRHHPGANLVA